MFSFAKRAQKSGLLAVGVLPDRVQCARFAYDGALARLSFWHEEMASGGRGQVLLQLARGGGVKKSARCATLLAPGDYRLLQTEAPAVPEEEIGEALRWQLRDQVDLPVETAVIDHLPLPDAGGGGRPRQVFAALAAEAVIAPLVRDFQAAGLDLQVIDLPELAQRNIAALFETENRGLAFLAFGETSALLTFNYQGELFALRRIEIGAAQFAGASAERRDQLAERVVLEMQRSMDTVNRQFSAISLSRLMLLLPPESGLEAHFANAFYLPFETADLATVLDLSCCPALLAPEMQRQALPVLGAALRREEAR